MDIQRKKYLFRADGNAKIGVGHIMRTLTIAEALAKSTGADRIGFICSDSDSAKVVSRYGFETWVLETDYSCMDSEIDIIDKYKLADKKMLVDSYYVTDTYLQALKKYGKVYILDDMQEKAFSADVVFNYNVFANRNRYKLLYGNTDNCFLGSEYVPIRLQFVNVEYEVRDTVQNVLITTGGGDIDNIAGQIYKILSKAFSDIIFHLVSGVYNPSYEKLKKLESERDNLIVYRDVSNMAEIMQKCDVAVSAGGSTLYELASIGVPTICFSYAKNQEQLVEYMDKCVCDSAGKYNMNSQSVLNNIETLFKEKYLTIGYRKNCYEREKKMIDGLGASRIAERIINS